VIVLDGRERLQRRRLEARISGQESTVRSQDDGTLVVRAG
jgi:hypothetical protein